MSTTIQQQEDRLRQQVRDLELALGAESKDEQLVAYRAELERLHAAQNDHPTTTVTHPGEGGQDEATQLQIDLESQPRPDAPETPTTGVSGEAPGPHGSGPPAATTGNTSQETPSQEAAQSAPAPRPSHAIPIVDATTGQVITPAGRGGGGQGRGQATRGRGQ